MNTGKAILGVLVGMAAGAAIGALFATDKQGKISKKGEDPSNAMIDQRFDDLLHMIMNSRRNTNSTNDVTSKREVKV